MEGDVAKESKNYTGFCDRIIMPLPEKSLEYLKEAMDCAKPGCVIHIYLFSTDDEIAKLKSKIRSTASKNMKKTSFIGKSYVLPYGPKIWKMRLDIKVL